MKRPLTNLPWILPMVLLIAFVVYGFWPQPIDVDQAKVTVGTLEVTVNDDGETRIREKYVISAPATGKLLRVKLHAGDVVKHNETELVRVQPSAPQLLDARTQAESEARLHASEASLQQAEAKLRSDKEALAMAEHDYNLARKLHPQLAISQAEFDTTEHRYQIAQANVRSSESGLKVAQFELEHCRAAAARYEVNETENTQDVFKLVSPIDGYVLRVFQEDAGVVAAATPLLELGDPTDLEIEIDVLSGDAVKIQPGDKVYIDHWGGDETLDAVVRVVEPSAFLKVSALGVEEKRVNVIADFADPWTCRQSLGDGFRIEARIVVDSTGKDTLKVPSSAILRDEHTWKAYRVVGGLAELCDVEVGLTNGLETEIRSGLSESDRVVLHPTAKIQHKTRVK